MNLNTNKKDPIAEKLHAVVPPSPFSTQNMIDQEKVQNKKAQKSTPFNRHHAGQLEIRNAKMALEEEQAKYATFDFVGSDDGIMIKLLQDLGLNPETITKATIVLEANQPVRINVDCLSVAQTHIGSIWTYKEDEE